MPSSIAPLTYGVNLAVPTDSDKDQYGHPRVPHRGYYDRSHCEKRKLWLERFCNCDLKHVGEFWRDEGSDDCCSCEKLKGNIENVIGLAKIPIGIAGPLLIHGSHISGYAMCPYATTEGALVASATRGAATLTRAGGVICRVLAKTMTRSPVFHLESVDDAETLLKWAQSNIEQLQSQISLYSQHCKLLRVTSHRFGAMLTMNLIFDTGDAAGQNMVTTATWNCCKWLRDEVEKKLGLTVKHFLVEGLASGDKKLSFKNLLVNRGVHVQAEAWIPESVITSTLKITLEDLLRTYRSMLHSCTKTGCIGFNVNTSNTLAAVFTATGQDIGAVCESSSAYFFMEPATAEEIRMHTKGLKTETSGEAGIYVSYELPSLIIGTVGGGTSLATQKECLQMMGCFGRGGVSRFAEIVVGFCLSLDISTLSSIGNGTFASAHEKLGKNRPDSGLKTEHLNKDFFGKAVGDRGHVIDWKPFQVDSRNSIISDLTKSEIVKLVGHLGYTIAYKDSTGNEYSMKVVVKSKPSDIEICNMLNRLAQGCGFLVASTYERLKCDTGFRSCSQREVQINAASISVPSLQKILPKIYHTIDNTNKDIYVIAMEYFEEETFTLCNTVDNISVWTDTDVKVVLRDLAQLHASFMSEENGHLLKSQWIEEMTGDKIASMTPLWSALLDYAQSEFPQFWTKEWVSIAERAINKLSVLMQPMNRAEKTLVHNDCNPRNICVRLSSESVPLDESVIPFNDPRSLCIYDWEMARVDVPQRDVVEFLAFTLPPDTSVTKRRELINFYRAHLEHYTGKSFPIERFLSVYNVACIEFAVNRLLVYTMVHTYKDYAFLPRVVSCHMNYLKQEVDSGMLSLNIDSKL